MRLSNKRLLVATFASAAPTFYLAFLSHAYPYYTANFYWQRLLSIPDCLFGMHLAGDLQMYFYCSRVTALILLRDFAFFVFYPISIVVSLTLGGICLKRFLAQR